MADKAIRRRSYQPLERTQVKKKVMGALHFGKLERRTTSSFCEWCVDLVRERRGE